MPHLEPQLEPANGTIRRIAPNHLVYVELDNSGERSVSFTPRVVVGYMGQSLHEFGIRPGRSVKVMFDPSSGRVQSAELTSKRTCLLEGFARGEKAIEDERVVSHADAKQRMARWLT